MLHEAALLVMAEDVLVEVLGRVRPEDEGVELPALHVRAPGPRTMAAAVAEHLQEEADLRTALTGVPSPVTGDVAASAAQTCEAVRAVEDGDRVALDGGEPTTVRALLVRATVERSLLAHYVAAHLGSTACPLTEELARPLWELTGPDADAWRRAGWFRAPLELPPHVSWRDRFLLTAGHPPHPLGH